MQNERTQQQQQQEQTWSGATGSPAAGPEADEDAMEIAHSPQMDTELERLLLEDPPGTSSETSEAPKPSNGNGKPKMGRTAEAKAREGYRCAAKFLRRMEKRDPKDLTERDHTLIKKNTKVVARFERSVFCKKGPNSEDNAAIPSTSKSSGEPRMAKGQSTSGNADRKVSKSGKSSGLQAIKKTVKPTEPAKPDGKTPGNSRGSTVNRIKRIRSEEEERKDDTPKKPKVTAAPKVVKVNPSTQKPTERKLQVAIVDGADLDGKITAERWLLVEKKLLESMAAFMRGGGSAKGCIFHGAGWSKGVKVVSCDNEESLSFLVTAISEMGELWQGSQLRVIPQDSLPLRKLARFWIPPPEVPDETILSLLGGQNPTIDISGWKIVSNKKDSRGKGRDVVFAVDKESFQTLTKSSGVLRFGLGSIRAKIGNGQQEGETATTSGAN